MKNIKNIQKLNLKGQELTLRHLKTIFPNSQALIIGKILYCLEHDNLVLHAPSGDRYVKKTLREWSNELKIWFGNGSKRRMSEITICLALRDLVSANILKKYDDGSRTPSYSIIEHVLIKRLQNTFEDLNFEDKTETNLKENYNKNIRNLKEKYNDSPYIYNSSSSTSSSSHKENVCVNKKSEIQDMFDIWKEEFPRSNERLDHKRSRLIHKALAESFGKDLDLWRKYLKSVKTIDFIMQRPYLMTLKWLLNSENVAKIKNGFYEANKVPISSSLEPPPDHNIDELLELENSGISMLDEPEVCKNTRLRILKTLGPLVYKSWFKDIQMEPREGRITCHGPQFKCDRIAFHYSEFLKII